MNLSLLRNGYTIARTIKNLQARKHIRRIGSDKTGHWEIIKESEGGIV